MALFRLRAARLKDDAVCAVDSTSEVVLYSLDDHMPVYYRSFPGNIPDSRSVETLLTDLRHAGFPNVALLTAMTEMQTWELYGLRDEQEKYFQQMKSQLGFDRQRNWLEEEGKMGRQLILFVGLILSSYVRHIWKATDLHKQFSSTLEVLDEMRSIRCVEHTGKAKHITPFVDAQIDITNAFGFKIPDGCAPKYTSRKKDAPHRGRPSKPNTSELEH